ncbi:hypothetical protein M3Y99_00731400 [Aphelenchoides fujianensis]|nr:hypothetical protein M3Y99_00731400 [Aphelenchoides fujianensis]
MTSRPPTQHRAPMSISEYVEAQREAGSCREEFTSNVKRATTFGAAVGVPFGLYVGYRHHGRAFRAFAGKSFASWFACTLTFGGLGVFVGTYNCLRVIRD